MSRAEKKAAAINWIPTFFKAKDPKEAKLAYRMLCDTVLIGNYPEETFQTTVDAKRIYDQDILCYLHLLEEDLITPMVKHRAYIALRGIIDIIDFMQENNKPEK